MKAAPKDGILHDMGVLFVGMINGALCVLYMCKYILG